MRIRLKIERCLTHGIVATWLIAALGYQTARADFEIGTYLPRQTPEGQEFCIRLFSSISGFTRGMESSHPLTRKFFHAIMAKRVRDLYPSSYPHIKFTEEMFAGMEKENTEIPWNHEFFLTLEPHGSPNTVKGFTRYVTNWSTPGPGDTANPNDGRLGKANVLPTEQHYKGLDKYLDKHFPFRMEPGRVTTDEDLGQGNRQAAFVEFLREAVKMMGPAHAKDRTAVILECESSKKEMYEGLGFRELTPEEIRKTSPDFKPKKDFHLMIATVKGLQDNFKPGAKTNLPKFDRAIARSERGFSDLKEAFEAGDVKKAKAIVDELKKRDQLKGDPDFERLELDVEVAQHYDFRTGQGDVGKAIEFLLKPETAKQFGKVPAYYLSNRADVAATNVYLVRLLLKAGRYDEAKVAMNQMRETERELNRQKRSEGSALGWSDQQVRDWIADTRRSGPEWVETLLPIYDPSSPKGTSAQRAQDAGRALQRLDQIMEKGPNSLYPEVRKYRADLLDTLGRKAEADRERREGRLLVAELLP